MPMKLLRTYLNGLDSILGGCTDIPEKEWPVLYAMLCAAVCEANEDELVKFASGFIIIQREVVGYWSRQESK